MASNKSFDVPISSPPDKSPRQILQIDNQAEVSEWGAIAKCVPKPQGGVPLQRAVAGRSNSGST